MNKIIKVGVTGGIGAGKTLVAKIFNILGAPVYNADNEARKLTNSHKNIVREVNRLFGENVYIDGKLDRELVASKAFGQPNIMEALNKIIHPVVGSHFKEWCENQKKAGYIIKEAALLFETGSYKELDTIITVTAPIEIRTERVLKRDPQRSKEQVKDIMDRQMPEEKKAMMSDYVIHNDDTQLIVPAILKIHKEILTQSLLNPH